MKLSIITPVLNGEKFINNCIASVQSQSDVEVEHIVVDGGSTDKTIKILENEKYFYINAPKSSIYEAINAGIKASSGEIIGFLNVDDHYASSHSLGLICQEFLNNNIYFCYGNCNFINENGTLLYKLISDKKLFYNICKLRLFNASHPCFFVKRSVFNDFLFDTSYRFVSDCDFFLKLIKYKKKYKYLNFSLVNFVLHQSNQSSTDAAKNESKELFSKYNRKSLYFINRILLILLYYRDFRYFKYRLFRL
jgi:glycosyltransferase involved in cell wall biosynthesis